MVASANAHKTQKVRWAVVGLGNIAQVAVLPAFEHASENAKLVALVSSDHDKRDKLGKKYGALALGTYDELESVIEEADIEAVYVAVPTSLHREMTERVARAGANVLCEKPMATTSQDCEAMIEACEDAGVKLMIARRLRFEASKLGEIGEPRIFTSVLTNARARGGALLDMGVQCVAAARHVFGAEPLSVVAMQTVGDDPFRRVDETTSVVMRFPGDRIAQLVASEGVPFVSELRVIGTKGDAFVDAIASRIEDEIVRFSNCIALGTAPESSGTEGLADVRIIEAIIRSAATREVVHVESIERTSRPSRWPEIRRPGLRAPKTIHAPSPSK